MPEKPWFWYEKVPSLRSLIKDELKEGLKDPIDMLDLLIPDSPLPVPKFLSSAWDYRKRKKDELARLFIDYIAVLEEGSRKAEALEARERLRDLVMGG